MRPNNGMELGSAQLKLSAVLQHWQPTTFSGTFILKDDRIDTLRRGGLKEKWKEQTLFTGEAAHKITQLVLLSYQADPSLSCEFPACKFENNI